MHTFSLIRSLTRNRPRRLRAKSSIKTQVFTGIALLFAWVAAGPAAAQTAIRFSLDFRIDGPAAPILVAIDKGYFKAEGLDVTVNAGTGSAESIGRVASGSYDMALGDINSLIRFRDANPAAAIKAVFMVYNQPPFAIIGRKSRGITVPKDLEGKKLGAPAADDAYAQWKVFAQLNNIDTSKVTVENVSFPVREPMLAAAQVDAITGTSFTSYVNVKERGVPVDDIAVLLMSHYGVQLYGNSIIAGPKFAAENPQAVRGFLRAFLKGLKETARAPKAAIESVLSRSDIAKKEIELERLKMALRDNILTPEVKTNGYGDVDMARLDRSIEQIALGYTFKAKPKGADIFDPSFLPSAAERKAN